MNKELILKRLVDKLHKKSDSEVLRELEDFDIKYSYNSGSIGQVFLYNDLYEETVDFSSRELEFHSTRTEYERVIYRSRLNTTPVLSLKDDRNVWGGLAS